MSETRRVFRWFWAWNDEQEEAWLTEMAQEGWHLRQPGILGFYTFEKGMPRNVVYRLDYQTAGQDKEAYLQLFADAGWEHVGEMGGWQYFRTEAAEGERPEIYTDQSSKVQKYQRLLLFLVTLLPIFTITMNSLGRRSSGLYGPFGLVVGVLVLLYAYALVRIFIRMLQLRR